MRFRLVAAGGRMPAWVDTAVAAYAGRMPRECRIEVVEIPLGKRGKRGGSERALREESRRMLAVPGAGDSVIALEVGGRQLDSAALARQMQRWFDHGGDVLFFIGGPDGLGPGCAARAGFEWSLSRLTLPHALVRVLVAEQLYRAYSILHNHPYHRA